MKSLSTARTQLVVVAISLVMAMSPWFSTAAVLGQLKQRWDLGSTSASWLTIAVQIGFVVGAVASSVLQISDRTQPRHLILGGTFFAAAANTLVVVADSYGAALVLRAITGAALAGVYPPAMKLMSSWFAKSRGMALGVMIGALTLGSGLPHLLNAITTFNWQYLMVTISFITVAGGLMIIMVGRDGPHSARAAKFDAGLVGRVITNRGFRLASIGYFGHMWELYAMWAWIAAFYGDIFASNRQASLAAGASIGAGAIGSIHIGLVSDRTTRSRAAARSLRWSGLLALITGFLVDMPPILAVAAGLVWGYWVVADSAQFSTIVTETVEPSAVGTALTIQLAIGFSLTILTIFLVPLVRDSTNWATAFAMLAAGPVVGLIAMHRLERHPPPPATQQLTAEVD